MARPCKTGLHYFPFDVDFFDDFKIMDLLNEYGTLGVLIYENILCKVYKNGYYLEIPLEKLAASIVRDIGNRWAKDKKLVLQVIQYCADIGLFNHDLLTQSVITSAGIQRRYQTVTVRSKLIKSKYWLLEKENDQEVLINAPSKEVNVAETPINVAETPINVAETIPKENININLYNMLERAYNRMAKVPVIIDKQMHQAVKLHPHQMVMLPRKYWRLTNNGFLMECFYIHKHILFFKHKGEFVIGAPARETVDEEMYATRYGFQCKISIKEYGKGSLERNYWIMNLN